MILLVGIDNCVVLSVKIHAIFVLNRKLISTTLKKQTNPTFVNLKEAFICFILFGSILNSKVCLDRIVVGVLSVDRPDF